MKIKDVTPRNKADKCLFIYSLRQFDDDDDHNDDWTEIFYMLLCLEESRSVQHYCCICLYMQTACQRVGRRREREREREREGERERERDGGHLQKLHVGGRGRSGRIGRQHSASLSHKLSTDVLTEFHQQEGIHFQVTTLTMPGVIQIVCFLEIDEQHFIA